MNIDLMKAMTGKVNQAETLKSKVEKTSENTENPKKKDSEFSRSLKNSQIQDELKRLKKVSQEFEGILLQQMMKAMRNTVMKSDLMGDRNAEEMFQGMLDQEYTNRAGAQEKYGLAAKMYEQLSKNIKE